MTGIQKEAMSWTTKYAVVWAFWYDGMPSFRGNLLIPSSEFETDVTSDKA
jgi:hypothetical protein